MFLIKLITQKIIILSKRGDDEGDISSEDRNVAIVLDSTIPSNGTTGEDRFEVKGRILDLDGKGFPEQLSWELTNAQGTSSGTFDADISSGYWEGQLSLASGDNTARLFVPNSQAEQQISIAYNPGYSFAGLLQIIPDVAYVNEERQLTAFIALTDPLTDPENVRLVLVNETSGTEDVVANLTDDGNLDNGDEIEGDNIYTGRFYINEQDAGAFDYRVVAGLTDGNEVRSEPSDMLISEHITDEQISNLLTKQEAYQEMLEQAGDDSVQVKELVDTIVQELENDPDVEQVGKNDSGLGVWIVYKGGIGGVLYSPMPGIKGGRRFAEGIHEEAGHLEIANSYSSYYKRCIPAKSERSSAESSNTVKSNKALVIAAQYFDWGNSDDIPEMKDVLEDSSCFDVNYVKYTSKGGGSVEDFKRLGDYGIILISSHGDSFYKGLLSLWTNWFGWNGPFGQVVLHSNMKVTTGNKATYEDDLKRGRLVLWAGDYGIMPTFVEKYAGGLPNSLVYMSICRGTWNDTMAKAFLNKGAGSYLGYDDYVAVSFCKSIGPPLIRKLLEPEKAMADAFVSGQKDPSSPFAEFKLFGATDLSLESAMLQDGGFESGNISQAWKVDGDARIIPVLGSFTPSEGDRMAIISTGLGFTTATGTLSQTICLSSDSCEISLDWNFLSEEFLEYVGSEYQDSFTATIAEVGNPGNSLSLINVDIDSLSNEVYKVENSFDQGDVYATGWKNQSTVIPESLRGKKVELKFYTTDIGDSIYDTALLIDNVKVDKCP